MISRPRLKLTLWFTILMLAVYAVDGVFALITTDIGLTGAVDEDLQHMCQDLLPALHYKEGQPSLHQWGATYAKQRPVRSIGVQLFSPSGVLLEEYGRVASQSLVNGRVGAKLPFYSHYLKLRDGAYLQVQMPARQHDQAMMRILVSKLWRVACIAIVVLLCGWYYSGKVLEPVVRSLQILRAFIDDAGHELKTPVTVIENSIETIESDLSDLGLPTSSLQKIQRASTRLKGLATNMILLARMEQPAVRLILNDVQLSDVLRNVEGELADVAQNKGVALQVAIKNDPVFCADKEALNIMISNLVRNAIQHTPAGGSILVGGGKIDDRHLFVSVEDTGEGIPPESLPMIFNRFYRVDNSRSTDAGGSGLGLAIVKAIATLHGGAVRADSEVGKGSSFRVVLPVQQTNNLLSLNVDAVSRRNLLTDKPWPSRGAIN